MVAKGRTMFKSLVDDKAESLKTLLVIIPEQINKIKKEREDLNNEAVEEYLSWNIENEDFQIEQWIPQINTDIYDEMLQDFYASMLQRIYSFCEICLSSQLQLITTSNNKRAKNVNGASKLEYCYEKINSFCGCEDKPLKEVWTSYNEFHGNRVEVTHENLQKEVTQQFLLKNIEEVQTLLTNIENKIIDYTKKNKK